MMMQKQVANAPRVGSRAAPLRARPSVQMRAAMTNSDKLPKWDVIYSYLTRDKGLRTVAPDEAKRLSDSGEYVLVDVRPPSTYKDSHPAGSVSVPMYQPLDWSKPDFGKVMRFIAYQTNGVTPVEPNPDFIEQMKAATAGGAKGLIMMCETGGTLTPSTNFLTGKPSRSLQAAFRCFRDGVTTKVLHLERGVYGWNQEGLPFEGEKEYVPDVGRTPNLAAEPVAVRSADKK